MALSKPSNSVADTILSHFSLLLWNIGQANREEQFEYSKWANRRDAVKQLIDHVGADLVALLELRQGVEEFLSLFPGYTKVTRKYCHYKDAFSMCLMVNTDKFFIGDVRTHNFEGIPGNDKMVMFVDLQCRTTMRWITVGVTHFAMEEPRKQDAVQQLRKLLPSQRHPTMCCGDYNFFDDKDLGANRAAMLEIAEDVAHPLQLTNASDMQKQENGGEDTVTGTFVGFPHDAYRAKGGKFSRLDHIFVPDFESLPGLSFNPAETPMLPHYCLLNDDPAVYNYPSDHLAIVVPVCLQSTPTVVLPPPSPPSLYIAVIAAFFAASVATSVTTSLGASLAITASASVAASVAIAFMN